MVLEIADKLSKRLEYPLPGLEAQRQMSARLKNKNVNLEARQGSREGGVLILLYPNKRRVQLPLMQRPPYDGVHGGQISFPGGKREPQDHDLIQTALREAEEEIGIDPEKVQIIGTLSKLFITASNFKVLPVVGFTEQKPDFIPEPKEVIKIIETDLNTITQRKFKKEKEIIVRNYYKLQAPYYDVKGHVVWGATAMILSEFEEILHDIGY